VGAARDEREIEPLACEPLRQRRSDPGGSSDDDRPTPLLSTHGLPECIGAMPAGSSPAAEPTAMPRLTRGFFARPCREVAPALLGCLLVHECPGGPPLAGRIVEVEAYLGPGMDAASHAYRRRTRRNCAMFGPPGRLYVYRSMGLHVCANVVCEEEGRAAAVLLRAVEPLAGLERMHHNRGGRPSRDLSNGPGKLCQAFGITLADYGRSLLRGPLHVEPSRAQSREDVRCGPRVGVSRARELRLRFFLDGNPWVSRSPLNRLARRISRDDLYSARW
jgi:DNA-3-methyladenine glycosylase